MKKRPVTTLFLLTSVDGKISSGAGDALDVDRDWRRLAGVREGLGQYEALERETAPWSLNTGRVMAKIGVNERELPPKKLGCSFVIVDSKPHLTCRGVEYLCRWTRRLLLVTANKNHPAFGVAQDNLQVLYQRQIDLEALLETLAQQGVEELTIQSGGMLNGAFLRRRLLDRVDVVVAPLLVGGAETPTLIDGPSLTATDQLDQLGVLRLVRCTPLAHSYLRLQYEVLPETIVTE